MNAWSNPDMLAPDDAMNMALFLEKRAQTPDQQLLNATGGLESAGRSACA